MQMVWLMLNGSSALSAFQDESVVQEYRDSRWNARYNQIVFRIFPLPDASDVARSYHFPAWIENLTVTNIPAQASHIRVELYDGASNLMARKNFTVTSDSMVIDGFEHINLPAGGNPTIKVYALDSERDVIRTKTLEIERLEAGANEAEVGMGADVWVICSGPDLENCVGVHFSIYSTLEVYLNGELVKAMTTGGGWVEKVLMNATAGDTLRLVFRCDWTSPLHWHYSQFIEPLWLVHMENPQERHLQLTEYMDFGWSDDEPNPEGFDLTFTIPDFG